MIKYTEEKIFEFLDKELSNKGIKVYRGFLPQKSFEDRENGNYKENFPYVTLRIVEFKQERAGIDYYDSPVEFEIWVATKENGENDYLENLSLANEIMEKLLEETTKPVKDKLLNIDNQGSGFVIDQTKEFKVSFHSDQYRPYFFSRISFSVYGEAISSVYTNKL